MTGPERTGEVRFAPLEDHERVLQAANEFLGGRYPAQNQFMIDRLREEGQDTSGLIIAVALHDIVDKGLINPKNEEQSQRTQEFISTLYDQIEDKGVFTYGLGCAISAAHLESVSAQTWRSSALNEVMSIMPKDDGAASIERTILIGAITNSGSMLSEFSQETIKAVLQSHHDIGRLDTGVLREADKTHDKEVHLIKIIESEYNIENPPPNNIASTFRDCQEIMVCYGPICHLMGFRSLAARITGKALESLYDDPEGLARKQYEISEKYKNVAEGLIYSSLAAAEGCPSEPFAIIPLGTKTEGSTRKKLNDPKYAKTGEVPDGSRTRVIVGDDMSDEEIDSWAKNAQQNILSTKIDGFTILDEHPLNDTDHGKTFERITKNNGYSATHVVFTIITPDGPVRCELQFVTEDQELWHQIGKASAVLRKAASNLDPKAQAESDIAEIYRRGRYLREPGHNPALNPNTWALIIKYCPNLDTPLRRAFGLNSSIKGKNILGPHSLATMNLRPISAYLETGTEMDTSFLPLEKLTEEQFFDLLGILDPELLDDRNIKEAVQLAKKVKFKPRYDGSPTLECHILPTAIYAGILSVASGERWEIGNNADTVNSATITAAVLHDVVEETRKSAAVLEDGISQTRQPEITIEDIKAQFGEEVGELVGLLTSPEDTKIEDEYERRTVYAREVVSNFKALRIKFADKFQNHTYDSVRLVHGVDQDAKNFIFRFAKKTDDHFSAKFMRLPDEYKRAKQLVWEILRYHGYERD